ncbi:MAG TPA: hypothetical protein VGV88_01115 [Candidatus Dormibacteraeota bacterium]|nr:hypothetical protein [Candidatus Dormibacteraeota bacterium]
MSFGAAFLLLLISGGLNAAVRPRAGRLTPMASRVIENEHLTAVNGALLFVLLVALAITVLLIRPLLSAHFLIGFMLVPPLALKLWTTSHRFLMYYLRDPDFRVAGPPPLFLRFIVAPALVAATLVVMATGLELWAFGDRFGTWWVTAHTVSAVAFMAAVFFHLVGHSRRSATAVAEDLSTEAAAGAFTRRSVMLGCLILSFVLAAASLTYATPFVSGGGGA